MANRKTKPKNDEERITRGTDNVFADLGYPDMASKYFHQRAVLDPLLHGEDKLNGLHGNTQIPKVIGLAREYELTGNPQYRLAAESFMFRDHLPTSVAIYKIGDALRTTLDYDAGMIREGWRRESMESSDLVDEAEAESRVMASFGRVYAAIREGHATEKEKDKCS